MIKPSSVCILTVAVDNLEVVAAAATVGLWLIILFFMSSTV